MIPDFWHTKPTCSIGREVELTPTSITLTNHKGMMIRLDDEEGIQIISDKDIKVDKAAYDPRFLAYKTNLFHREKNR